MQDTICATATIKFQSLSVLLLLSVTEAEIGIDITVINFICVLIRLRVDIYLLYISVL